MQAKSSVFILKGVSERLNYLLPYDTSHKVNGFYDLRYSFPLQYLSGQGSCLHAMGDENDDGFNRTEWQQRRRIIRKRNSLIKIL